MIIDSLQNSAAYESLHPLFKKAFDYLKTLDFSRLETGKTYLQDDDLYISIANSQLKSKDNAKLEVHNKYIDIQIPVSCGEDFGWTYRKNLSRESTPFNVEKDIQYFQEKPEIFFNLEPGNFVIFFPEDGHAPCIGEGEILKIVVKVKV